MADAMLQENGKRSQMDAAISASRQESNKSSETSSSKQKGKQPANPAKTVPPKKSATSASSSDFNAEALSILRQMNSNINKTNKTVEELTGRVDALYGDLDYDQYQGNDYDTAEQYQEYEYEESVTETVPTSVDAEDDVFSQFARKFQKSDSVDADVSDHLAAVVSSTFRDGMTDEHYGEVCRNILRPSNCEALKETRVNSGVWSVLKPTTQTEDSKMRGIQNSMVKAACNLVQVMDKGSHMFDNDMLVWGTDAIGLLGQANRWINIRRRELHKKDMDPKLHHLCSSTVPFTDQLYGDSMIKDIKDIQELNKISRAVVRGAGGGRFRGRGHFRGRRFQPYTRRASSGRGRSSAGRARLAMIDQKKSNNFRAA